MVLSHFSVQKGDIVGFVSDGMRTEDGVPDEDARKIVVSLAGMDVLDNEALSSCEKA